MIQLFIILIIDYGDQNANDCYYYLNCMEDSDVKIRQQLVTAGQLFTAGKFAQCRKVLGEVKMAHPSIELNQLIAESKDSPGKVAAIAKKIIDSLAQLTPNTAIKPPYIPSELHYWNAVVLSQLIGQAEVAELVSEEGIRHAKAFRTETMLMLAYSLLSAKEKAGRLASCLSVINIADKLADRNRSLSELEKAYRFMIQVALTRVLLKLKFGEAAKIAFMMRFNQAPESKEELQLSQISGVGVAVHQQLLHAEIEYHSGSHPQAIKILSELFPQLEGRNKDFLKSVIDHNMGIILTQLSKAAAAQTLLRKSLKYLTTAEEHESHNQRHSMILKCKENMILAGLLGKDPMFATLYESIKDCGSYGSYKQSYRKAEVCIKYYHQLLTEQPRILLNKEVHDSYEPTYFYPNQPYFQQKGKNKNPNFTNGRAYYRRYVMSEWEGHSGATLMRDNEGQRGAQVKQEKKKEKEKQKSSGRNGKGKREEEPQKQPYAQASAPQKSKLNEILALAESYLKQALVFLERQMKVLLIMGGEHRDLTNQANTYLHTEYTNYKSSIYSLLTYVKLNQRQWAQAFQLTDTYLNFAVAHLLNTIPTHYQTYYSVLAYRMEALCEMGRIPNAYEAMQETAHMLEYFQDKNLVTISTSNQQAGQSYYEEMSQLTNFYYNLAVLHSRDNKIPEVFQAIQKFMQQISVVPSSPQARMSLSTLELLIHYNLRTGNTSSALQLIKRRRILTHTGAISHHHPPTLGVTK